MKSWARITYIPLISYPKVKVYNSRGEPFVVSYFFTNQDLIFGLVFSQPAILYYKDFAAAFFLSLCLKLALLPKGFHPASKGCVSHYIRFRYIKRLKSKQISFESNCEKVQKWSGNLPFWLWNWIISNLQITEHHIKCGKKILESVRKANKFWKLLFTEEKSHHKNGGNQMLCKSFLKNCWFAVFFKQFFGTRFKITQRPLDRILWNFGFN